VDPLDGRGLGGVVEVFRTMAWFDRLRQLPERFLANEVVEVIQQRDDLAVLLQLIVAAHTNTHPYQLQGAK